MNGENHIDMRTEGDAPVVQNNFRVGFKHKAIPNFKVGRFQFVKGILRLEAESEEGIEREIAEFMHLYRGLHGSDKAAIVKLREIQNEERLDTGVPQAIRGAVGTHQIADKETTPASGVAAPLSGSFFSQKR